MNSHMTKSPDLPQAYVSETYTMDASPNACYLESGATNQSYGA